MRNFYLRRWVSSAGTVKYLDTAQLLYRWTFFWLVTSAAALCGRFRSERHAICVSSRSPCVARASQNQKHRRRARSTVAIS